MLRFTPYGGHHGADESLPDSGCGGAPLRRVEASAYTTKSRERNATAPAHFPMTNEQALLERCRQLRGAMDEHRANMRTLQSVLPPNDELVAASLEREVSAVMDLGSKLHVTVAWLESMDRAPIVGINLNTRSARN